MHIYPRVKYYLLFFIVWQIAAAQETRQITHAPQKQYGTYAVKYWRLDRLDDGLSFFALDTGARYIASGAGGIRVWRCGQDFALEGPVYSSPQDRRSRYDVQSLDATSQGLTWMAAYDSPAPNEPGNKLLLWDTSAAAVRELKWGRDYKFHVASPDGTRVALFLPFSVYEKNPKKAELVIDVFDLDGRRVKTIEVNKTEMGDIGLPVLMDKWSNFYLGREEPESRSEFAPMKVLLGFVRGDTGKYTVVSRTNEVLVTNMLWPRSSYKVFPLYKTTPLILDDGATLATYVYDEGNGRYFIGYYRDGKLVKSVNDPVPNGAAEVRLAITSDGKGVVTQAVSGEKKGLVKVWDIETGKSSDVTNAPPVRYIFPWVQGRYAPIWTSSDAQTYEGGILEITRNVAQ